MACLGIITCEILELEFAHLLSNDPDVAEITVVEDATATGFIEALQSTGRLEPRRLPILKGYRPEPSEDLQVLVRVLELALHNRKRLLQDGLTKAVAEMARYVDAILLGYGLCGNALENPQEMFADIGVPIIMPMDQDHPIDDCVGLIIGGREEYYAEQCREAGTFFMIPGWTRHWRRLFEKEFGNLDPKIAKRIFSSYRRSLLLPNDVLSEEEMRKNIAEFNELFGFQIEVRKGTLSILHETWQNAKKLMKGISQSACLHP